MARPRTPYPVILEIYRLRGEGKSIRLIEEELTKRAERGDFPYNVPSGSTIGNITKRYGNLPMRVKNIIKPFEWQRLDDYKLPSEASSYLLALSAAVREYEGKTFPEHADNMPPPLVGEMYWAWQVHQAAPDVGKFDVWFLAQRFVIRELIHYYLGEPLELEDLNQHLAYRPWEDGTRGKTYQDAVESNRIPRLRNNGVDPQYWEVLNAMDGVPFMLFRHLGSFHRGDSNSHMLPSQQMKIIGEKVDTEVWE